MPNIYLEVTLRKSELLLNFKTTQKLNLKTTQKLNLKSSSPGQFLGRSDSRRCQ